LPARTGPRLADLVAYLLGVVVLSGSLTVLWLSMRAVMDIGGMCASGGPYVVAVECPDAVAWLLPLAIFAGLGGVGVTAWFGGRVGPGFAGVAALAWPALFLSLGWNFLEYGLASPGGWDLSWLLCGVLFLAMGGIPLVIGIQGLRRSRPASRGRTTPGASGSATARSAASPSSASGSPAGEPASQQLVELSQLLRQVQGATVTEAASLTVGEATGYGTAGPDGMVDQLERLARLRQQGALGEQEYLEAQQAVIDAASRGGRA
jgi:hypothetical protein